MIAITAAAAAADAITAAAADAVQPVRCLRKGSPCGIFGRESVCAARGAT